MAYHSLVARQPRLDSYPFCDHHFLPKHVDDFGGDGAGFRVGEVEFVVTEDEVGFLGGDGASGVIKTLVLFPVLGQ